MRSNAVLVLLCDGYTVVKGPPGCNNLNDFLDSLLYLSFRFAVGILCALVKRWVLIEAQRLGHLVTGEEVLRHRPNEVHILEVLLLFR